MKIRMGVVCLCAAALLPGEIRTIDPPAGAQSGMPFFTKDRDAAVLLAWRDTLGM